MSWMYSDEDYWREQKEQHKAIMKELKRMAQLEKEILKHLWVPVYDKQGKAFIEPKKHAAWRRAVKWNARPINTNGQYIKDALEAGLFRLYTSSEDVFSKKREMIEEDIQLGGAGITVVELY